MAGFRIGLVIALWFYTNVFLGQGEDGPVGRPARGACNGEADTAFRPHGWHALARSRVLSDPMRQKGLYFFVRVCSPTLDKQADAGTEIARDCRTRIHLRS